MDGSSRGKTGVGHKCVNIKENKHIKWGNYHLCANGRAPR